MTLSLQLIKIIGTERRGPGGNNVEKTHDVRHSSVHFYDTQRSLKHLGSLNKVVETDNKHKVNE